MNQTTSRCGAWCDYYYNGQCTKAYGCVYNYMERPDENHIINESYNPYIEVNESRNDYQSLQYVPPKTIHIDCNEIYLTKGGLEIKIDLTSLDFNDISQIIINGVKFNKE